MTPVPPCRPITVLGFVGDRSGPFVARVFAALRDGRSGRGPGPSALECLLLAGHTGVSTDPGAAIFGFNPEAGGLAAWQVVYGLRNGDAFPGIVTDDTGIFTAARQHGLWRSRRSTYSCRSRLFSCSSTPSATKNSKVSIPMVSPTATETVTASPGSRGSGC